MNSTWKCLSVREFINQCNWEQITRAKSAHCPAQQQQSLTNWQCLTVQDFFSLHNWSGQRDFTQSRELAQNPALDFNLTLPNDQFWQCFNWSGVKPNPNPEKVEQLIEDTEAAIAQVKDFSLNDLSQLF